MDWMIKLCGEGNEAAAFDWTGTTGVSAAELWDNVSQLPLPYSQAASVEGAELRLEIIHTRHAVLNVVEQTIRITHLKGSPVTLLQVNVSLDTQTGAAWQQGGYGQPAFSADRYFAGVRHPYGMTETSNGNPDLSLRQHPGKRLEQGEEWTSAAFVFGFSPEGKIRGLFDAYIHDIAKFKPERVWIYGDWALHDELAEKGRSVELTESMTRENVQLLKHIDSRHNIHFDYYLVDHGWYSPSDFTVMKQPNFTTNGLKWLSDELEAMGAKLGLWFPVNTYSVNADGIFCGLIPEGFDGGAGSYCLKSEYGKHFRNSMLHAVEQWGVKLIKLDFADFECKNADGLHEVPAAAGDLLPLILREQESEAFLDIMRDLNAQHPDVVIVAFNGFIPSPWWLENIDTLYIGDVQPCEVPAARLRTSVNLFTEKRLEDYETGWNVHRHYLDDCGTFVGETTTNFYLGKEDWRSQGLLSLGRGAKLVYYYGDLGLLDEEDLAFLGAIAQYDRQCSYQSHSYTLGNGDGHEPFAYVHDNYAAVYNPTLRRLEWEWTLPTGTTVRAKLAPYEAQWIDLSDGSVRFSSGEIQGYPDAKPLTEAVMTADNGGYRVSLDRTNGKWVQYFIFTNPVNGKPVKVPKPSQLCTVESNVPYRVIPDEFCWSGLSWIAVEAELSDLNGQASEAPWMRLKTTGEWSGAQVKSESWWIPAPEKER